MAKEIQELSLMDIAPPSIKSDEKVAALIKAIDPELLKVSDEISEAFIYARLEKLPEPVLDLLAWQWHVDFYELSSNIQAKREMIRSSIKLHRHKGTRGAIIQALEMLGVEAKFTAWFEDQDNQDNPYTFAIDAKLTGDFWERVDWTKPTQTIRRAITESKSARSYISRLYVYFEDGTSQGIQAGLGIFPGAHHVIGLPPTPAGANAKLTITSGTAVSQGVHRVIGMKYASGYVTVKQKISTGFIISQAINSSIKFKEV